MVTCTTDSRLCKTWRYCVMFLYILNLAGVCVGYSYLLFVCYKTDCLNVLCIFFKVPLFFSPHNLAAINHYGPCHTRYPPSFFNRSGLRFFRHCGNAINRLVFVQHVLQWRSHQTKRPDPVLFSVSCGSMMCVCVFILYEYWNYLF